MNAGLVGVALLALTMRADGQVFWDTKGGAFRLADVRVAYVDSFASGSQHEGGRLGAEDLILLRRLVAGE